MSEQENNFNEPCEKCAKNEIKNPFEKGNIK